MVQELNVLRVANWLWVGDPKGLSGLVAPLLGQVHVWRCSLVDLAGSCQWSW